MPCIHSNTVGAHDDTNLKHDGTTRSLDTQNSLNFVDVVRGCFIRVNSGDAHHITHTVALNQDAVLHVLPLVVLVDHSTTRGPQALNHSPRQGYLECLQGEEEHLVVGAAVRRLHPELVLPNNVDVLARQPDTGQVLVIGQSLLDVLDCELQLQLPDGVQVNLHRDEDAVCRLIDLLEVHAHVTQSRALDAALDDSRAHLAELVDQGARDDWC
mmetsp:Transcript_7583/g.12018  ORF Transcript_7583/g.12018 Transcript_7583/m.12018 type:complete len:213 (+) Transcript_7583:148-786(+)